METPENELTYKQGLLTKDSVPEISEKNLALINNSLSLYVNLYNKNINTHFNYLPTAYNERLYYMYLVQKYDNNCTSYVPPTNDELKLIKQMQRVYTDYDEDKYKSSIRINARASNPDAYDDIAKILFNCIKNTNPNTKVFVTFINLFNLESGTSFNLESGITTHANLLIYRKELNQLEHFEPNGPVVYTDKDITILQTMEHIVNKINQLNQTEHVFDTELKYINPSLSCPESLNTIGFQVLQAYKTENMKNNYAGTCMLWSSLIGTLILENPEVSTANIQDVVFNYALRGANGNNNNFSKMLVKIVIGYGFYMMQQVNLYLELIFAGTDFEGIVSTYEQYIRVISMPFNNYTIPVLENINKLSLNKKNITNTYYNKSSGENIQEFKEEAENNIRAINSELTTIEPTVKGIKQEMSKVKRNYDVYIRSQKTASYVSKLLTQLGLKGRKLTSDYNKYKVLLESYKDLELKRIALIVGKERLEFVLSSIQQGPFDNENTKLPAITEEEFSPAEQPSPPQQMPVNQKNTRKSRARTIIQPLTPEEEQQLNEYLEKNPHQKQIYEAMYSHTNKDKRKFYDDVFIYKTRGGNRRKRYTKRKGVTKKQAKKRITKRKN